MTYGPSLPEDFVPLRKLVFCSNTLIDVPIVVTVDDEPILLIGQGAVPSVWLAAPIADPDRKWVFVVRRTQSANPGVRVQVSSAKRQAVISVAGHDVLRVSMQALDEAVVDFLDLRPIGLMVSGNANTLTLGTNRFASNTIQGASVAFALGSGHPPGA